MAFHSIVQASAQKDLVQNRGVNADNHSIASIDAVDMYPSIIFVLICDAAEYFSRDFTEGDKGKIGQALELIKSSMSSTLINFMEIFFWDPCKFRTTRA